MKITPYLIVVLLLFGSNLLFAQGVPAWGGGADQNDLSFGFSFSYVSSDFKIVKKPDWRLPFIDPEDGSVAKGPLNSISSAGKPGFAVGFLTRYSLTDHLEVRTTPSLVFADRSLMYTYEDPTQNVEKIVQSTTVDLPLSLKLKSDRLGNFRAYVMGGVKYSQAIGSKKNADANDDLADKLVKNNSGFGSYEAGVGCDIYFEFFKLSPEIKISNSFGSVLMPENQPFSSPISKLSLHTIMFSLIFE